MAKPTSNPTLNSGNTLFANLFHSWLMWEGSGTTVHDGVASPNNGTFSVSPAPTWTTSGAGDPIIALGSAGAQINLASGITLASPWTIAFRAKKTNDDNQGMILGDTTTTTDYYWHESEASGLAGSFNSTTFSFGSVNGFQADHIWMATYDGNTLAVYKDGSLIQSSALGSHTFLVNTIGAAYTSTGFSLIGTFDFLHIYSVVLDPSHITAMNANPYQMYQSGGGPASSAAASSKSPSSSSSISISSRSPAPSPSPSPSPVASPSPSSKSSKSSSSSPSSSSPGKSSVITEQNLPSNHAGNITVHVVGTLTTFSSLTTWTATGIAGWSVASKVFVDATHYTVVLAPPGAATPPLGATGTLTLIEGVTGSTMPTTSVGTPTLSIAPFSGNTGTTPTLTLTGTNTIWGVETLAGLFAESGGTGASIGTPTLGSPANTTATATLTTGSAAVTLTITDTSTGAATTFSVSAATISLGWVGDSIHALTNGFGTRDVPTICGHMLEVIGSIRTVNVTNQAVSGSATAQWVAGQSDMIAALAAFTAAGTQYVLVTLGANDASASVSAATYGSNMANICSTLIANGQTPILNYPPYRADNVAFDPFLLSYQGQIDSLINGTTILRGDVLSYPWFQANHAAETVDGVHPNGLGSESLAEMEAYVVRKALFPDVPAGLLAARSFTGGIN